MLARLFRVLLVCFLLMGLWGCPASPPAGIPAPVSELLAVGNPDASGNVQITGAPGSVLGDATVNGNNNLPTASFTKFIFPEAQAAVFDSTTANPDGSFTLTVSAQVGDVIQLTQSKDGKTSPPTDLLVNGDTVNLGFDGQDVDVDEFSGFVFASAVNQTGLVFRLDFSLGNPPSLPSPYCNGLDSGITHLALDGASGTGFVIAPDLNGIYSFSLVGSCDPTFANLPNKPLDVAADPVSPGVMVGLEAPSGSPSVISYPFSSGTGVPGPACAIEIVHPGQASQMATTLVATGPSPNIFAVSQFSDGSFWVTRLDVTPNCKSPVSAGILLPSGILPGGIAAVNTNMAIVSDANLNQAFLLDFVNRTIVGQVTVGKEPQGIAVDPQANRAYVVNLGDNSISTIDLNNFSLLFTVPSVGLMPNSIDLIPGGGSVVVLSTFDDSVVFTDVTP